MRWDVFCTVIDNHGDLGVCWRLCRQLAQRGESVRLWVDDASALAWMAPERADPASDAANVDVLPWPLHQDAVRWPAPGDVVIEAFGCTLPDAFVDGMAAQAAAPVWINLEYLSAEPYALRCHGLPSPVMSGPGRGLTKHFYYPGFAPGSGGLLRESDLAARQQGWDRQAWRAILAPDLYKKYGLRRRWISLFCYEPESIQPLLMQLAALPDACLLVTPGRAAAAVRACLAKLPAELGQSLPLAFLPVLPQTDFDALLWACDLNFVRGEDSLVRALWAGRPLVWQIYPQDDGAHQVKLQAFLDQIDASPLLRQWHQAWNGGSAQAALTGPPPSTPSKTSTPTTSALPGLAALFDDKSVERTAAALWQQDDLHTQLLRFVKSRARGGSA